MVVLPNKKSKKLTLTIIRMKVKKKKRRKWTVRQRLARSCKVCLAKMLRTP